MELINQPFNGQLGNTLINLLQSKDYDKVTCVVAFAKNSGILRLKKAFEQFRSRGGEIHAYIGVDLDGTSYEALLNLLKCTDSLYIVHFEGGQTFHPKYYLFEGQSKKTLIVGSSNLTGGGLWTNCECSLLINSDDHRDAFSNYAEEILKVPNFCLKVENRSTLDDLLDKGYVFEEVKEIVQKKNRSELSNQRKRAGRVFGRGISASIPKIKPKTVFHDISSEPLCVAENESGYLSENVEVPFNGLEVFWISSGAMTGGSRNILDLSKKSLLIKGDPSGTSFETSDAQYIRGAVEFFGLDPSDESKSKDIVLNYEGTDYYGNTILYPTGSNANGTWRIQIKGVSTDNDKITDALRTKGDNYLTFKILCFSRISDTYYYLSVLPCSILQEIQDASFLQARNGATASAKEIGYLKTN